MKKGQRSSFYKFCANSWNSIKTYFTQLQGNCRGISLRLEITEEGEEHGKER
jgi:hypothetical protein